MKIKKDSRQKLQGTVLFTVVAVMMVVLVFIMSALTIAGATSRRAYSDYAKNQTQYTARTAIEATVKYLNENEDFQSMVEGMSKNTTKDVTIEFPSEVNGLGSIDVTIKCEGKDVDTGEDIVTITATSGMLQEETSVVAYISKKAPESSGGSFNRAMTSMGGASISNHTSIFGGSSINVLPSIEEYESSGSLMGGRTSIQNEGALEGETFVNGDLYVANSTEFIFDSPRDSLIVYGCYFEQNGAKFTSNVEYNEVSSYNQLPYIFVKDVFLLNGASGNSIGSSENLINIYCSNINISTARTINGDIYAFGTDAAYAKSEGREYYANKEFYDYATDEIQCEGVWGAVSLISNQSGTKLLGWADKVISGIDKDYCGGSIYSAGSFGFTTSADIAKDVYIQQGFYSNSYVTIGTSDDKTVKDGTVKDGTLYVGGKMLIESGGVVQANKLIVGSLDDIVLSGDAKLKILNNINADGSLEYKEYNSTNKDEMVSNNYISIIDKLTDPKQVEAVTWEYPEEVTYDKLLTSGGGFVTTQEESVANYYGEMTDGSGTNGFYSMQTAPSSVNNTLYQIVNAGGPKIRTYKKVASDGNCTYNPLADSKWEMIKEDVTGGEYKYNSDDDKPVSAGLEITENCTLVGDFSRVNINVKAPAGISTLSINCAQFSLGDSGKSNFIIDDTRDLEGVPNSVVKLYTDTYINLNNSSCILTKSYNDMLTSGATLDIKKNPTKGNLDEMKYIPNLYIYCKGVGKSISGADPKILVIGNNSMITGYIYAPEGDIYNNTTYNIPSIKYDGATVSSSYTHTMNIGAVICDNIEAQNNASIFYINPEGTSADDGSDGSEGSYKILYYNNG